MNEVIKTMYILFLKWEFPLVRYNGEVYFSDKTFPKKMHLDRFANEEVNYFLNKYAIIDEDYEKNKYDSARMLIVNGQEVSWCIE